MDPDLDALLADAVAASASGARRQERVLRQAAEESATFLGTLVDLAERGETVVVRTCSGRSHRGTLRAVGRDFVVVREPARPPVFVVAGAVASVRAPRGGRHDTAGDRPPPIDASFAVVLANLAGHRPRVQVGVDGEDALLSGELRAVGRDVVTLHLDAAARPAVYLPVAAVSEVVLLDV